MFEINYWIWTGILSDSLCDAIIDEGDLLPAGDGMTGGNNNNTGQYNPDIRETNISFFDQPHWIHGICMYYANIANYNAGWNFEIYNSQNVQYARYFPDQHYSCHEDDTIKKDDETMRKLSVSIQLTDPNRYAGGEFKIQDQHKPECYNIVDCFKPRGSVIVFPSVVRHGVNPVIQGVRHSVVCWLTGPKFR